MRLNYHTKSIKNHQRQYTQTPQSKQSYIVIKQHNPYTPKKYRNTSPLINYQTMPKSVQIPVRCVLAKTKKQSKFNSLQPQLKMLQSLPLHQPQGQSIMRQNNNNQLYFVIPLNQTSKIQKTFVNKIKNTSRDPHQVPIKQKETPLYQKPRVNIVKPMNSYFKSTGQQQSPEILENCSYKLQKTNIQHQSIGAVGHIKQHKGQLKKWKIIMQNQKQQNRVK